MEDIYRSLQKHLNKQAVGFPATKSGAEIRILKRFFNPEEARIALYLTYQPRSIAEIYETVKAQGISFTDLKNSLDNMASNGAIEDIEKGGIRYYRTIPFVVGIYEWQVNRLTPEFLDDVSDFMSNPNAGLAFLSTKVSQMRTIPIEKSINVEHHITTYDNLKEIIDNTEGPISIQECICRQAAHIRGNPCQKTSRLETCMAFGNWAKKAVDAGVARSITKEEALNIARQNQADGLVLQPSNNQKVDFICACCGCCCGMLGLHKMLSKPVEFWANNFFASVDIEKCTGCGACVKTCQVDAPALEKKTGVAKINLNRCIGCGNCIVTCPSQAISLVKKDKQTVPPVDSEDLYKYIAENKAGTFGKMKLMAKLMTTNKISARQNK